MSTSQRDNRSSENSESTEFESDIETGAPNPNLNASQFETENGEQPNILTFNAPQKQMFSSESDSVSEHEASSKENEERPDTNWNLFDSSSDDEDIHKYFELPTERKARKQLKATEKDPNRLTGRRRFEKEDPIDPSKYTKREQSRIERDSE